MVPLESTTRQVGAGVSGTLKSAETRRMLLPFSMLCETVPVLAFGPWNIDDVWTSILAANVTLPATASAISVKTDNLRLTFFISVSPRFVFCISTSQLSRRRDHPDLEPQLLSGTPTSGSVIRQRQSRSWRAL